MKPAYAFLTDAEALRLVNAALPICGSWCARGYSLAHVGELAGLQAKDVNLDTAQVYFSPAKSGRSRYVPLNDEGVTLPSFEDGAPLLAVVKKTNRLSAQRARDHTVPRRPWG